MYGAWQFRNGSRQPLTENHQVVVATRPPAGEIRDMLNLGPRTTGRAPIRFRPDVARLRRASWAFTTRRAP